MDNQQHNNQNYQMNQNNIMNSPNRNYINQQNFNKNQSDLKISCPKHDGYLITHGCSYYDCQEDILFCSQCLLEHLQHANDHKVFIFPLNQFIIEFNNNIKTIKEQMKPYHEVYLNRASHLSFFNKYMQEQKTYINQELNLLIDQFQKIVDRLKEVVFSEIDGVEHNLLENYDQMSNIFNNSEISTLQINNPQDLVNKLQQMPITQLLTFLSNIRSSFQNLKNPKQSHTIRSLERLSAQIQGFKKKDDKMNLSLNKISSKVFPQFSQEIEKNLSNYLSNYIKPINYLDTVNSLEISSNLNTNYTQNQDYINPDNLYSNNKNQSVQQQQLQHTPNKQQHLQNSQNINNQLQRSFNTNINQYSGNNNYNYNQNQNPQTQSQQLNSSLLYSNSEMKNRKIASPVNHKRTVSPIKYAFSNQKSQQKQQQMSINRQNSQSPFRQQMQSYNQNQPQISSFTQPNNFNLSQQQQQNQFQQIQNFEKNFIMKMDYLQQTNYIVNLNQASFIELEQSSSSFALLNLNQNLIAVGGNDCGLRVFEFKKYNNQQYSLNLIITFYSQSNHEPVLSLCKLNPGKNRQQLGLNENENMGFLICAGCEKGQINVWKFNTNNYQEFEQRPIITLYDQNQLNNITCLLDIPKQTFVISGDSSGNIKVWNYLTGNQETNYNYHQSQINCMVGFQQNQYFAAGGQDGQISLWEIIKIKSRETKIDIKCYKIIQNKFSVFHLGYLPNHNQQLIITDANKNIRFLNPITFQISLENDNYMIQSPIYDILVLEVDNMNYNNGNHLQVQNNNYLKMPYLLGFTKSQLLVIDGNTLEIIKTFQKNDMNMNNISILKNNCSKVQILQSSLSSQDNDRQIYFSIIDQSQNSNKIISVFCLNI